MEDVDDPTINVPVIVRSHEQNQLESMVPTLRSHFEHLADTSDDEEVRESMAERAATIEHIESEVLRYDGEREDEAFVRYLSFPFETWQTFLQNLRRIEHSHGACRVQHVQRKLFKRVRDRMEELQ
jgi:hypothetical protein